MLKSLSLPQDKRVYLARVSQQCLSAAQGTPCTCVVQPTHITLRVRPSTNPVLCEQYLCTSEHNVGLPCNCASTDSGPYFTAFRDTTPEDLKDQNTVPREFLGFIFQKHSFQLSFVPEQLA